MGNKDGILDCMSSFGMNETLRVGADLFFSFAHGDEIALVTGGEYYILNCDLKLWQKVKNKVAKTKNTRDIFKWWLKQSKSYEISCWSGDFKKLEEI